MGLAQEDETPEANTVFVADISVEDETTYIKYHVCNLNAEDETEAEECATLLDDDLPDFTDEGFWTSIEVETNEEGEYNHGSFVSAFAEAYEGEGKGCLVRYIAQSDWGKPESTTTGDELLIEAETFCAFNKNGDTEVEAEGDGPPPWAGKPASVGEGKPPWAGPDGDETLRPGDAGEDD